MCQIAAFCNACCRPGGRSRGVKPAQSRAPCSNFAIDGHMPEGVPRHGRQTQPARQSIPGA
eukprot:1295256-Lingulodinium_polyedra.AAC.1